MLTTEHEQGFNMCIVARKSMTCTYNATHVSSTRKLRQPPHFWRMNQGSLHRPYYGSPESFSRRKALACREPGQGSLSHHTALGWDPTTRFACRPHILAHGPLCCVSRIKCWGRKRSGQDVPLLPVYRSLRNETLHFQPTSTTFTFAFTSNRTRYSSRSLLSKT